MTEEIKWSRPFFVYKGEILCNISAFKEHCSVGFWGAEMSKVLQAEGAVVEGAMGTFGRIRAIKDLPPKATLLGYIREAAAFIDAGEGKSFIASRRVVKARKPELGPPDEFLTALKKSKTAAKVFDGFSPSCKREYVEWIADAKRPETRDRRIAQALEWISEGKQRHWKYQNC